MRVALLSKREIDTAKAKDRSREIAEGLKLTRKVDGLRELQAEAEVTYEKFLSSTLQEVQRQIDAKITERDNLLSVINTKKAEWERLLQPLDKNWKRYVEGEKALIATEKATWEQRNVEVTHKSTDLSLLIEQTAQQKATYIEGQDKNAEQYMLARRLKDEAKKIEQEAILKSSALMEKAERKEKATSKREMDTELKLQNVLLQEQTLKRKEDELEDREMKALAKELLYYSPVTKK